MIAIMISSLLAAVVSAPSQYSGWDTGGSTATRPAISYVEKDRPRFVMTCEGAHIDLQVRGFKAAQQWPQPVLTVKFGAVERSAKPDLKMIGDQTALSFSYPISDSMLMAFKSGALVNASYHGGTLSFPVAPPALRREFADRCAALVPPGMRKG